MRLRVPRFLAYLALPVAFAACSTPAADPPVSVEALIREARAADLAGRQDEAIALYRRAIDQAPDSYDAHYGLGRALDLAGDYDGAREHFQHAIDHATDEDRDQVLRMMGIAWAFAGRPTESARYFEQVFERRLAARNFGGASEVANELGRVYLELGDVDLAESWYRRGHDEAAREPDRAARQVDLADMRWAHAQGRIAARRGQEADARRHEREVRRLLDTGGNDDQRVQLPYLSGYIAFALGQDRAALAALAEADQTDPFVLVLMGQAHERLGERDQARDRYTQALASTSHAVNNAFARPLARARLDALR